MDQLEPKHIKFIDAYFKYQDISQICKECDITRQTYYNYLNNTKINKEINRQLTEMLKDTTRYLKTNINKCCITLMDIINDAKTPPQVKINAINCVFTNTLKFNEQTDIIDKLQVIEDNLKIDS